MKKMIFFICALFFVLTGFNQQERFVEQSDAEILGSVSAVGEKAEFLQKLMNVSVNKGGIAVFLAQVTPIDAEIKWYYRGKPIVLNDRIKIYKDGEDATLVINKVKLEDAGTYGIVISGGIKSEAKLTVRE